MESLSMDMRTASEVVPPEPEEKKLVERTWAELGYKVRPLFAKVFIRTEPPPEKIGLIYLPPKEASFFGGLGHQRLVTATVLSTGPMAKSVKVGERVVFQRLHFGHIAKMEDKTFVGWVEQEQIAGYPDETTIEPLKA